MKKAERFSIYVENPNKKVKKFNEDGNNRFIFINKFLNYAFFTIGISSLSDLTIDIGRNFLNAYGMHELPDDDEYVHRGKGTVEKCIKAVLDFYINLTNDKSSGCKIKSADLYRYITVRDKYGKAIKKMIPQFDVKYIPSSKEPIFRDIPNKAFTLLFDHIAINHTELLGLVMHTKVRKGESFGDMHPELIEEYDPSNEIDIFKAFPNGKESVKWICKACDHKWEAAFALRHMGSGKCPKCYKVGRNIKEECFAAVYPEYVELWSSDNERTPYDTFYTSNLWIHWNCQNCGSVYGAEIKDMISGDVNCPYCKGMKVLAGFNSLKVKNPELAKQISPLNEVDADHILPSKHSVQLWRCPDCGGDYAATTLDMENGYTCPYCNDRLLLKGFNSFGDKHPDLLEEMDEIANYLLPYTEFDVLDTSDKKFWWTCPKNPKHKYSMSPKTRLLFQKRNREPCLYCRGQRRKLNHFIDYKSNK